MADRTMRVEVLATGTHKGVEITREDLDRIAANHAALAAHIKPPVKLGHSSAQLLAGQRDGDPALGWVDGLKRVGDKLVATLTNVPSRLADMIAKRRYRRVSAELALDFANSPWETNLQTGITGKVLTGLALLGADLPAVANLEDLATLLASETGGTFTVETDNTAVEPEDGVGDVGETVSVLFPRTVGLMADMKDAGTKTGGVTMSDEKHADERVAELEAALAAQRDKDAERDAQMAQLTAAHEAMRQELDAAKAREAEAVARQHEVDADRFVEQYSRAECLKLTTPKAKGALKALYLSLVGSPEPLVSGDRATALHLSETPTDLSGVAVLTALIDALPDQKVMLTQVASPSAGKPSETSTPMTYQAMLEQAAKDHNLNLSMPAELAKASQIVLPKLKGKAHLALEPAFGVEPPVTGDDDEEQAATTA